MADNNYLDKGNSDGTILGQSSSAKIGFWGITPGDQAAALTTALTTITYTTATAIATTITAAVTAGFGFINTDEAQSFLLVVQNVQARLAELETALKEAGLVAGGTATALTDTQYDRIGTGQDDGDILGQDSSALVGFWGITPCDQPGALTAAAATVNSTALASATTYDYTIATLVSNSVGFGFSDGEAYATLFLVVSNMQARIAELETNLAEVGVIAGGTAVVSTTSGSAKYDYLDKGNGDGTILGVSSSKKIGFWGTTPVDQPAALTTALTTITCTAPGTTDYAIQSCLSTIATFKFVTMTAAETLLHVVQNAHTRLGEIEAALEEIGLTAAN